MNGVERGHQSLVRGHRSSRRALVGSEGLNNGPQLEEQYAAVQSLGGKAVQKVIIPPTPTEIPPTDYAG